MTLVSCLDLHIDDSIATLTIRRQHKLNALTGQLVDELFDACRKIEKSNAWVVIISGEGSKAFSAGGDIEDWSSLCAEDFALRWVRDGHDAFDALARLRQPVIAVLNGHTLGGGLELAACADYRIAESHVKLGQPEAGLGIITGWSGGASTRCRLAVPFCLWIYSGILGSVPRLRRDRHIFFRTVTFFSSFRAGSKLRFLFTTHPP